MRSTPRILIALILISSLGALCPAPGAAQIATVQVDEQVERVERELLRTRDLLERVAPQVLDADIPRAGELLKRALEQQRLARTRFELASASLGTDALSDRSLLLLRETLTLTLRARDLAVQSGQIAREQVSLEERARRTLQRARQMYERIDEAAEGRSAPRVGEVLQRVRGQLERSQRQLADGNPEISLRLSEGALSLLQGLQETGSDALGGPDRLELELRRTRDLLSRAREGADRLSPAGRRSLDRAGHLLREAEEAFARERFSVAHDQLEQCRALLRQLIDETQGPVDVADVEAALERLDAGFQRLGESWPDPPPPIRRLLRNAVDERDRARRMLDEGDPEGALPHLRAATEMLNRARRRLQERSP